MKFFAIALVILSHVVASLEYANGMGQAAYVIRSMNMPLFMFLSGFVLFGREGKSTVKFIQRKYVALLVPYFAWLIVGLLMKKAPLQEWGPKLLRWAIDPHATGAKWFLYLLFVFYVLFAITRRVSATDAALLAVAAGTIALTFLPKGDVLGRLNVEWLFTFFVAGYLTAKHRHRLPKPGPVMACLALAVFVALLFIGRLPESGSGWPPAFFSSINWLFERAWWMALPVFLTWKYATAFAGIVAVIALYSSVDERLLGWQAFAGRRSLGIYLTQGLLLWLSFGDNLLSAVASTAVVLAAALVMTLLLESWTPTRVVLLGGRRHKHVAPVAADAPMAA